MKRLRIIELINKLNLDLELDLTRNQLKISFESNDSGIKNTMTYNDILDYVEGEYSNVDGHIWKFWRIISHSLISGKKGVKDKIEVQMMWETGAISTKCYEMLQRDIPVDLAIYATENNLLEEEGWKHLKRLAN